jgi:hypothetical protein
MTFLKKLGSILLKATEIVTGVGPLIGQIYPQAAGLEQRVENDLVQIGQIIVTVETLGQALNTPGADKLKAAAPLVAQIILKSAIVGAHEIDNPMLFQQGAQKIADGMADVLNSLKPDRVKGESKT